MANGNRKEENSMNKINWEIRFKNKTFWLALVPAVLLLVQSLAALFGYQVNFDDLNMKLIDIINAVFVVLVILGVVTDPTTDGVADSKRALQRTECAPNCNHIDE